MPPSDASRRLEAQLEHLRSEEHLRDRVAPFRALTPSERLEITWALCRAGAAALDRLEPERRERALSRGEPPGPGADAILRRLARLPSPGEP
jgi:hypothetical protein